MPHVFGRRIRPLAVLPLLFGAMFVAAIACGGGEKVVVQTVVVEKQVPGEKVVETVIVEKKVPGEKVVQTVIVEKPVTRVEKVVETVIVEKEVAGKTQKVVETVLVEKPVTRVEKVVETVVVEKQVTVEKVVVATPTPAPTAAPPQFVGNFVLGEPLIPPRVFLPSKQGTGNDQLYTYWGILEALVRATDSAPPVQSDEFSPNGLATAFEIAPDGGTMTFTIRSDAEFHHGWGPLTAQDICFSFQNASQEGSVSSRIQSIARWAESYSCPNDTTFVIKTKDIIDPEWVQTMGNNGAGSLTMVSKKAFDALGPDRALLEETGTGPFESTDWVAGEFIKARPFKHYRKTPSIASYTILVMPESSTRIAALKTGQIHLAKIPLKFIVGVQESVSGAWTQKLGPPINQVVFYSGNYWAETDLNNGGKDVYRKRPGFKPDADHPWIGDPADATSMENARKVREALNIGFDRDAIIKEVQSGLGQPSYTFNNAQPGRADWSDEYVVSYDPDKAKQLITDAGYPNGFKMKFHVAPGKEWSAEVGAAVAQFWRGLGLDVEVDSTDYAAARPRLVQRSKEIPWMIQSSSTKPDAARCCLWPTSGFGFGVEVPNAIQKMAESNLDLVNTTFEERVANNMALEKYINLDWHLMSGVATLPTTAVVRPEVIKWSPVMLAFGEFNSPETIVMKP